MAGDWRVVPNGMEGSNELRLQWKVQKIPLLKEVDAEVVMHKNYTGSCYLSSSYMKALA
jgi:hypothetical protein